MTNSNRKAARIRLALAASTGAFAAVMAAPAAYAQEATQRFDIPAQTLGKALLQLGRQARISIAAPSEITRGRTSKPVAGDMTAREALARMLEGSGLEFSFVSASAVRVTGGNGQGGAELASSTGEDNVAERQEGIAEILVVGSRSQNVDIKRSEDDPQPYVVFDSKEIERSGASNLDEFFRKKLPMTGTSKARSQVIATGGSANSQVNNTSAVNLRGLSVNQTLILVDGRRAPKVLAQGVSANGADGGFTQADLNGIPLSAIERIEILPSTAGGIYGGGATGGVINIIRKRDYKGIDFRANFGSPFRGGSKAYRIELSGGFTPDHGKTQISFSAAQAKTDPLVAGDNDLWQRSRKLFLQNEAAYAAAAGPFAISPFRGYTTNILSAISFSCFCHPQLTLKPLYGGTALGSDRTFVPVGFAGVDPLNPSSAAGLVANAGDYNFDISQDFMGKDAQLTGGSRVRSGNINIKHEIASWVEIFADFSAIENISKNRFLSTSTTVSLPASATNNPFQQAILVSVPQIGLDREQKMRAQELSLNTGAVLRLGHDWSSVLEYDWSQSKSRYQYTSNPLTFAATAAFADGTLNPIRDVNAFPLNFAPFEVRGPNVRTGPMVTTQSVLSGRTSGTIFDLPGGRLALTTLLEHRKDAASEFITGEEFVAGGNIVPPRTQSVNSAYVELRAPIISSRNEIPLFRELELQASIRRDSYRTHAKDPSFYPAATPPASVTSVSNQFKDTNFTIAGRWAPVRDLALRASYATGFLPPNINQIVPVIASSSGFGQTDPKRGNSPLAPYTSVSGGNPNLGPERTKAISLGAIFTPSFISGLRLSIDYSRIKKNDEIGSASILALEDQLPGRVIRAPLTAADQAAGFTGGVIQLIDSSLVNIANTDIKAWDFNFSYQIESAIGVFTADLTGTYQKELSRQTTPLNSTYNSVGFSDGPLKWRVFPSLSWERGPLSVTWSAQYYHKYDVGTSIPSIFNNWNYALQGSKTIPSQIYHDLGIGYKFRNTSGALRGAEVFGIIENVFDRRPPVTALGAGEVIGTYSTYGDPRLRRFNISIKKSY